MEDMLRRIGAAIAAVEKELGFDWRFSYWKLLPRERGAFEIEFSREEIWQRLPGHLDGFSVTGGKDSDRVATLSAGGIGVGLKLLGADSTRPLLVVSSVADVRREPSHSAELLTQLIMGETAVSLKAEGDWFLVRLPDDYHGWIRSWYVRETAGAEIEAYRRSARTVVEASVGYVLSSRDARSLPVCDVVAGTKIVADDAIEGFRAVTLPGGRRGFIREEDVAPAIPPGQLDRERLAKRAMRFLGIPYLWGGATPKGFDCSGLVMRVFLAEGVSLPRDSDRQALVGVSLPAERARDLSPGDLLFFGEEGKVGHVALSLGKALFIHAYGEVKINSLSTEDERYDEKLAKKFLFARSVLR